MNPSRASVAIVMPYFFTNRVAAVARYILELTTRDTTYRYSLVTTRPSGTSPLSCQTGQMVPVNAKGHWDFYRQSVEECRSADMILFYGGYLGALLFMCAFQHLPQPKILNLFSYKISWRDFQHLKFTDFIYMFQRIFRHPYFWGRWVPDILFRHYFQKSNIRKVILPSRRLQRIYRQLLRENRTVCLYPGGDLSPVAARARHIPAEMEQRLRGKTVVLHTGLASLLRGVDDLITAYSRIPQKARDRSLLLLCLYLRPGEKIYSCRRIRQLLHRHLREKDYLLWEEPLADVAAVYDRADICVFPYRYVGDFPEIPLTMMELLTRGKTMITYRLGSIPELVDPAGVCPPGDLKQLTSMLQEQILNGKRRPSAVEKSGLFRWDVYLHDYLSLIAECIH